MSVEGVDSVREGSGKFDFLNPSLFLHPFPMLRMNPEEDLFFDNSQLYCLCTAYLPTL